MSIQRLCYSGGGGGGPSLKPSQGLGYRGKEHLFQGNRRTKGPINFEGKGNIGEQGKIRGTREQVPSSLPGTASSVVCKVLISA